MSEYIVDFGDEKSSAFVRLAMAQAEASGARLQEKIVRCKSCKYYDECWTSEVYPNRHWCDKLTVYMPPNGFCSFGKRRWLTCKCGEEIETTGGAFAVCPSCGSKVIAGD